MKQLFAQGVKAPCCCCSVRPHYVRCQHGTARHNGAMVEEAQTLPDSGLPAAQASKRLLYLILCLFIINKHLPCSSKSYKKAANAKALIFWPRPRLMCYIICLDYGKNLGKQKSGCLIFSMTVPPLSCNYNMLFEIIVTRFCVTPLLMRYLT